jgi:hypothetical protein
MDPNSLCARVLQSTYYPDRSFIEATAPRAASKTWRAILAGREALRLGLVKRIGSRETVSIWDDSWIPFTDSKKLMGRKYDASQTMVNELIMVDNKWNTLLIRAIFFTPDADAILKIPLRCDGDDDLMAWSLEESGIYSVKSAYRALMERNHRNDECNPDRGSTSSKETLRKKLWKLAVIPKVRVFWWRVLHGILPDYGTITRQHVMDDSTCGICRASEETLQHALTEYSHAKLFWSVAKEFLQIKLPRLHPRTWAADILCEQTILEKDRAMMVTLMYSIWSSRNNVTHGEKVYDPGKSLEFVKEIVQSMELPHDPTKPAQPRPMCLWKKPPIDVVKLNSDGAIQATPTGSGVVARDSVGFCGAMCTNYEGVDDPLTIEALPLHDVVFAKSRQYQEIVCEVDCSNLVRHW